MIEEGNLYKLSGFSGVFIFIGEDHTQQYNVFIQPETMTNVVMKKDLRDPDKFYQFVMEADTGVVSFDKDTGEVINPENL